MIFCDNQVIYYVKHGLAGQSQVLLVLFIYNSLIHFFGIVTFARSDICANDICVKWKGTKLGEGERD